jgi:hypothetical protein
MRLCEDRSIYPVVAARVQFDYTVESCFGSSQSVFGVKLFADFLGCFRANTINQL